MKPIYIVIITQEGKPWLILIAGVYLRADGWAACVWIFYGRIMNIRDRGLNGMYQGVASVCADIGLLTKVPSIAFPDLPGIRITYLVPLVFVLYRNFCVGKTSLISCFSPVTLPADYPILLSQNFSWPHIQPQPDVEHMESIAIKILKK